jgi:hypothetical protein
VSKPSGGAGRSKLASEDTKEFLSFLRLNVADLLATFTDLSKP